MSRWGAALAVLVIAACEEGKAVPGPDAAPDAPADAPRPVDGPVPDQAWRIPDLLPPRIGLPCGPDLSECGAGLVCVIAPGARVGVCTMPCDFTNPLVPFLDPCPTDFPCVGDWLDGKRDYLGFCLRSCTPALGQNPCPAPLACRLESTAQTNGKTAVCLLPGCTTGSDCPVLGAEPCQTTGPPCPTGLFCAPLHARTSHGRCASPGTCDLASGLCAPHGPGTPDAEIGDPCAADTDCGDNMRCLVERDQKLAGLAPGQPCAAGLECCSLRCLEGLCDEGPCPLLYRNGICTRLGCAVGSDWACPTGAVCNRLFPGGQCQRACDLATASDCRGHAEDQAGDYECRDYSGLVLTRSPSTPIAEGPGCEAGALLSCALFGGSSWDCSLFAPKGNPTSMACRAPDGTLLADPHDPSGYCLDSTASGP